VASDRTRDYAKSFVDAKDRLTAAGLPDGLRKTFISTLTVKIEQLSAAVVAGDPSVSVGELLSLRSALEELEPSTPMTVQVKLVNPSDGAPRMERCRRCGTAQRTNGCLRRRCLWTQNTLRLRASRR
jgi:hypothetical protein